MSLRPAIGMLLAALTALLLGISADARSEVSEELDLYVGSVTTLEPGTVLSLVVGNDAILSATVLENDKLVLLPKDKGTTELMVWTEEQEQPKSYRIRILPREATDLTVLIKNVMRVYPTVEVTELMGRTILSGSVVQDEFERFEQLLPKFPGIISTVKPRISLPIQDTIAMDVKILEVNKSYQKNLGVRWQDTAAGPAVGVVANIIPQRLFGAVSDVGNRDDLLDLLGTVGSGSRRSARGYFGLTSIIGSELQLLQENGAARMLAEPSLSTLSGQPATFLVGGEIPVAVLNQFGQPVVEFREFGIQMEIKPFLDEEQNIRSEIRAEVSSVDFSVQVSGVPGLLRREAVSTINARPGDTIILSGLVNASDSRNVDRVPWLGDIPILGALFKSRDFQEQRTELLVLVTPRLQKPNQPAVAALRENEAQLRKILGGSARLNEALLE